MGVSCRSRARGDGLSSNIRRLPWSGLQNSTRARRRRWRALALGTTKAYLEADAPRVQCPAHGVIVGAVPWARHGAGHTRAFDDTIAWLAAHCSRSALGVLTRVAWRTVGAIITRAVADGRAVRDPLAGLCRIRIDETSYRRGQRYLAVVDHDSRRLVCAADGRLVRAADAAPWTERVVRRRAPGAVLCTDPFHVVAWAAEALDQVRRDVWNAARRHGETTLAKDLKGARVEAVDTKIRLLTRIAFRFPSATALLALAMLSLGCSCPPLPGR